MCRRLPFSCNTQDQLQQFTKPAAWPGRLKCYHAFNSYRTISGLSHCSVQLRAKRKYKRVSNCKRETQNCRLLQLEHRQKDKSGFADALMSFRHRWGAYTVRDIFIIQTDSWGAEG